MPVIAFVKSRSSGSSWIASGKKVGAFRFTRRASDFSIHELKFPTFAAFNAVADELLSTPGNAPIFIRVEPEIAEPDAKLAEEAKALRDGALAKDAELDDLRQKLAAAEESQKSDNLELIEEHTAMLAERDAMLNALAPHAQGEETPLACLTRILTEEPEPATDGTETLEEKDPVSTEELNDDGEQTGEGAPPVRYDDLFKQAKELGLVYAQKPKRDILEADLAKKRAELAGAAGQ